MGTTEDLKSWIDNVSRSAYCKVPTLWYTYTVTRMVLSLDVPGDLVECGVANGVQPAVMARACMDAGKPRRIHLFDTFTGIPKIGPHDPPEAKKIEGKARCALQQVQSNLGAWGVSADFVYHKGMFEDVLPSLAKFPIAVLRLDGDLYSSTKVCLDELEPHLQSNGVLIIDDGLAGVRKAWNEYFVTDGFAPIYWQKDQK